MAIDASNSLVGREVRAANGAYLGRVIRATATHVVVEKGFFFPADFEIPLEEITASAVDTLHLRGTAADYHERFQARPEALAPPVGPMPRPFTPEELTEGVDYDGHGNQIYPGLGVAVTGEKPCDQPREASREARPLGDYPLPDDDGRTA